MALGLFGAFVVVAFPLILSYRWLRKLAPEEGDRIWLRNRVQFAVRDGDERVGPWVPVNPTVGGSEITFELPKLKLYIRPAPGPSPEAPYPVCTP